MAPQLQLSSHNHIHHKIRFKGGRAQAPFAHPLPMDLASKEASRTKVLAFINCLSSFLGVALVFLVVLFLTIVQSAGM